jgi:predicted DCC family thiol-disulfide oxidoreductase YuxK
MTDSTSLPPPTPDIGDHPLVLFDGVCNLCHGSVQFIIKRDPKDQFRFASLQSQGAAPFLALYKLDPSYLDSIVLIEGGRCYRDSTAALRVAKRLSRLWPLFFYIFIIVPRPLRDLVYKWIARNRYRWFGKQEDACWIPTPELRKKFL